MIGGLSEKVSFTRETRTQRADGGYDKTQAVIAEVWAEVVPTQAREEEQAGRLHGSTTYLVTIQADDKPSALTTDDGATWNTAPGGAVSFNIRAIRPRKGRALYLEIVCEQGVIL